MTRARAQALLRESGGRLCVRYRTDASGELLFDGADADAGRMRLAAVASLVALLGIACTAHDFGPASHDVLTIFEPASDMQPESGWRLDLLGLPVVAERVDAPVILPEPAVVEERPCSRDEVFVVGALVREPAMWVDDEQPREIVVERLPLVPQSRVSVDDYATMGAVISSPSESRRESRSERRREIRRERRAERRRQRRG